MKKLLIIAMPIILVVCGLPVFAILAIVTLSSQAAADCRVDSYAADPVSAVAAIDGPVGPPVKGKVTMATANIPARVGLSGFRRSMPKVLSTRPDFVALQEVGQRSLRQIEAAAPGYSAYRDPDPDTTPGGHGQSMNNVVLWDNTTWRKAAAGRVKIVEDDRGYLGKAFIWDRFATWVMLERKSDGAVVSAISVHHMTNPKKYPRQHGNPPLTRAQQYGQGMDTLIALTDQLAEHGPVLAAGDMNSHASYTNLSWSAAAKMNAAGYQWAHHSIDFVFFPRAQDVRLIKSWTGTMTSDHQWVAARLDMNGAGPTTPKAGTTSRSRSDTSRAPEPARAVSTAESPASADETLTRLMKLRLRPEYPTLTAEQARNTVTIAQVARDLGVSRRGLQIATATAIQESKLVNLAGGDRDSIGLFQQRPSTGWGTPAQVRDPVLATRAFYGRADHTNNTGLLDIDGWQDLPLTQAAQRVQRSGFPNAYAQWETVAADIADLLGGDLPAMPSSDEDCAPPTTCPDTGLPVEKGLTPDALLVLRAVDARFGRHTYYGLGERPANPSSDHATGRAIDVIIDDWQNPSGTKHGDQIAEWIKANAGDLGVTYVIWRAKIWSVARDSEGWRAYTHPSGQSNATLDHMDHVHVSVAGNTGTMDCGAASGEVVYPIPAAFIGNDARNWHATGPYWSRWHTGTDFGAPCGTPVYAAHAGTIQIDTTQGWAGPWLVKVSTGATSLTTWYAHMQHLDVSRGQKVTPGQQIGQVGDRGNSAGCHLHFEVHTKNGSIYGPDNTNPSTWLAENAGHRKD